MECEQNEFNLLLISSRMQFRYVTVIPNYQIFTTFSEDLLAISKLRFGPAFW
jgi:hypothetical protein